jgi:hypothetical protein
MADSIEGFIPIADMSDEQYHACCFPGKMLRPVELSGESEDLFHRWFSVTSQLTGISFLAKGQWRGNARLLRLAGYRIKINVPSCTIGNNCLLRNGVPAACELAVLMLKIWLREQGTSPAGVDAIDFERMRLTMVTPTFLHRYETHALAKAARNAFQAALEIRNSDKVRPGKGKKKKAFEVGDSEYRTGYMHERGFDICHYVKNRDTETVAVFTDDEERTAIYDEAERYHRVETKLHGAWLTENLLNRPEDWRLYGQERAYEKAYSTIRKTLRLDEGLRATKPTEEEIQQLSALDQTVLRWHLSDHDAQQHECILAKPTALARQQYFSDMKLRIMKKLHVDISVRWRRQERAMSGGLSAVLHYPGMYTPPPELEMVAFSTDSVRNAIHGLKSILGRMMPRNLSNLQLAAETVDSPPITLGSIVVSERARRALDKYLMPLHKLLGCHMWGIFGDVSPDEAIQLSEAARNKQPVTSRYTLGNFVILVTTQYLLDSNGVTGPVTSVSHSGERS